jgi:hypothetical protein
VDLKERGGGCRNPPSSLLKKHGGSGREPRRKEAPDAVCKREIGIGEARSGPQDGTLVEARSRGGNPWNLPYSIANRLMNNGLFAQLSDAGSKLLGTVGENRFAFNTALRRTGFDSAGAMKDFKDYQQVQNEEMKNRLAALQLEKMIDSFQARIDGIALRVDDTNDYWDEYTEDSLTAAGFRRVGTTFQKDIVTGSTITSPVIRELREIQQYQDMLYETPDLETASGIRNYGLVYDFDAVQALIANATKVVEAEEERVFGTGVREWRAEGGAWAERDEAPDLSKKKEQEKGWQNRGDGLFGKHVGYAPVYKSGYDVDMEKSRTKNIKYKGSGELGRILGYLSWYNMEEGAGYSQVNQPAWDKPLWDAYPLFGNEDWMMEAPSFAGAVDIVVQVVATVATAPVGGWGGAALGAAIGSVDDLLFTALELGTGYIIPEQALLQVGQTVLKAGVQFAAQGAFQGYEKQAGGLMAAWGKNFMGEATVNFLQQLTTNTLNGAIDAVELSYDDDGNLEGLGFDMERWGESVYGVRALAGYAGSFARSATQSLLKGTAVGFLGEGANNYNALIKTASALAGEGVGSLIDGEFSINVLNLTDILSPFIEDKDLLAKMDMGLFSMNFARDKNGNLKTTSRINSAGANVGGLVGLARSVAGLTEAYDNIRIGLSGADEKTAIALRGISSNGQEKSANLFEEILSGKTTLQEAFDVAVGQLAETTRTELGKQIGVDLASLNGFELGVVLAHEAMRNGRNDGEEGQRLETIDAVLAHSDHAMQVLEKYGLGALGYQMVQEAIDYAKMQNGEISQEDFEAYVDGKYDSTEDFWRLNSDGTLTMDQDGFLRDENGELIKDENGNAIGARGMESGLAIILGITAEEAGALMRDSGMTEREYGVWWNHDGNRQGQSIQAPENLLHYLGSRDHYDVLVARNSSSVKQPAVVGITSPTLLRLIRNTPQLSETGLLANMSYQEWTLQNAKDSVLEEIQKMTDELRAAGWNDAQINALSTNFSTNLAGIESGVDLLDYLRNGMQGIRNNSPHDRSAHVMLQFANQTFRGKGGDMGIAEALRAQYEVSPEANPLHGVLAAGAPGADMSAIERAQRYTIVDIAKTFTDDYIDIDYGFDDEGDNNTRANSQFRANFYSSGLQSYGSKVTGFFNPNWTPNTVDNPRLDCIGFVNMVNHCSGVISNAQKLNDTANDPSGQLRLSEGFLNHSVPTLANHSGVAYSWFSPFVGIEAQNPVIGDLMFFNGHIGFYGGGQNYDINEDGTTDGIFHQFINSDSPGGNAVFGEAGPRLNYFQLGQNNAMQTPNDFNINSGSNYFGANNWAYIDWMRRNRTFPSGEGDNFVMYSGRIRFAEIY